MKKLLLVIALVVIAACSNNGSRAEGAGLHELSNAALTTVNMKAAAEVQTAALAGAEVGCAALAQMVALAQAAAQTGTEMQDISWLAGWKPNSDLQLAANF
jgi:hypothetical protein